jgi:hypothetical protein
MQIHPKVTAHGQWWQEERGVSRAKLWEQRGTQRGAEAIHRTRHTGPVVRNAEELRRLAAEEMGNKSRLSHRLCWQGGERSKKR